MLARTHTGAHTQAHTHTHTPSAGRSGGVKEWRYVSHTHTHTHTDCGSGGVTERREFSHTHTHTHTHIFCRSIWGGDQRVALHLTHTHLLQVDLGGRSKRRVTSTT